MDGGNIYALDDPELTHYPVAYMTEPGFWTLTAAVWRGGDQVTDPRIDPQVIVDYLRERDERLCKLLTCLLRRGGAISPEFERRLLDLGLDMDSMRKCLAEWCRG